MVITEIIVPGPSLISFQDQQIAEDVVNTALLPVFTQMRIRTGRSEFSFLTSISNMKLIGKSEMLGYDTL